MTASATAQLPEVVDQMLAAVEPAQVQPEEVVLTGSSTEIPVAPPEAVKPREIVSHIPRQKFREIEARFTKETMEYINSLRFRFLNSRTIKGLLQSGKVAIEWTKTFPANDRFPEKTVHNTVVILENEFMFAEGETMKPLHFQVDQFIVYISDDPKCRLAFTFKKTTWTDRPVQIYVS